MVSGILPVVGVPLPFISYGGTAMVTLGSGRDPDVDPGGIPDVSGRVGGQPGPEPSACSAGKRHPRVQALVYPTTAPRRCPTRQC